MYAVLLILALNPQFEQPLLDRVDRVEVNHFYDDQCRLVFEQLLFWDWSLKSDRFEVVAWRLLKDDRALPLKQGRIYVSEWVDEKCGQLRRVEAKTFLETWTIYDRELVDRELLPQEKRRELRPRRSNVIPAK